jgi:hypothetical protein
MSGEAHFTAKEARVAGERIGIDWVTSPFDVEQFRMGMDVELEHGTQDLETNVTGDDVTVTARIARAHLNEFPDYYSRLAVMEAEAEAYWASRAGSLSAKPVPVSRKRRRAYRPHRSRTEIASSGPPHSLQYISAASRGWAAARSRRALDTTLPTLWTPRRRDRSPRPFRCAASGHWTAGTLATEDPRRGEPVATTSQRPTHAECETPRWQGLGEGSLFERGD